jgi:hypothetical protein
VVSMIWMMNEFKHVWWIERLVVFIHQNSIDSYISFARFVQCRFSKLLSTNILLFKRCKYVSPQKLTFLVQNMILQKWLQRISNIKILEKHHKEISIFWTHSKKILSKLLNSNLKPNLEGIFNFGFKKY